MLRYLFKLWDQELFNKSHLDLKLKYANYISVSKIQIIVNTIADN